MSQYSHLTAQTNADSANEKEEISDGVNLLVSMLVRYPEIGTISFEPNDNSLKLSFIISGSLSVEDYETVKDLLADSIASFHMLLQMKKEKNSSISNIAKDNIMVDIDISSYDEVTMLTVIRDVRSISCGEIALIINILGEQFTDCLAADFNGDLLNEDILMQDEAIENMLRKFRKQNVPDKSLIGIREEGRVFVFNK